MGAAKLDLLIGSLYILRHIDPVQSRGNDSFSETKRNETKRKKKEKEIVESHRENWLRFSLYRQDNYNALHVAAMYSREDVVKLLLSKRSVDPYATGGV